MTGPRTDTSAIRWLLPPPAKGDPLDALLYSLRRTGRSVKPDSATDWNPVVTDGPRRVFRRISGDHADYLKWFGEDSFSIRRRSGLSIWPTPARRHLQWSKVLSSLGVRAAPLIAAGEFVRRKGLFRQTASFIVTRSPVRAATIEDAARALTLTNDQRVRLATEILSIANRLHARNIARLDLRAANVLIYSPAEPPVLFDIDRLLRVGILNRRARIAKDMDRIRITCTMLLSGTGTTFQDLMKHRDSTS